MNRITKSILLLAGVLTLAAVSCQKDNTLYYNNLTMGNIVDGKFVSDNGNTFNIVEQNCPGILDTMKRAMTLCDVLCASDGKENEYDVRLNLINPVLAKDAVALADATGDDINVQNPVQIETVWYSGGYLNMLLRFPVKVDSKTKHLINLVYSKGEDGKYVLNLRHNAFGEVFNENDSSTMTLAGAYVSFPISDIISEDEANLVLNWKWYDSVGTGWLFTTEKEYTQEFAWKRSGFEHVPQAVAVKSIADIL